MLEIIDFNDLSVEIKAMHYACLIPRFTSYIELYLFVGYLRETHNSTEEFELPCAGLKCWILHIQVGHNFTSQFLPVHRPNIISFGPGKTPPPCRFRSLIG